MPVASDGGLQPRRAEPPPEVVDPIACSCGPARCLDPHGRKEAPSEDPRAEATTSGGECNGSRALPPVLAELNLPAPQRLQPHAREAQEAEAARPKGRAQHLLDDDRVGRERIAAPLLERLEQKGAEKHLGLSELVAGNVLDHERERSLAECARAFVPRSGGAGSRHVDLVRRLPFRRREQSVPGHERGVRHPVRVGHSGDPHGLEDAGAAQLVRRVRHVEDGGLVERVGLDAADVVHVSRIDGPHQRRELRHKL
mmetsp:Transcript_44636/g.143458  ORF Transcript_44636/g.143458 Transcript_44636/m.143458 type:complete len:255 (-) Transcript_44636:556-1320(-)